MKTFLIARCSSPSQSLKSQIAELQTAYPDGEVISGYRSGVSSKNKEALQGYIDLCDPNDKLVFLRLSRVARSFEQFLWFYKAAEKKQVNIVLLKDDIDFSTATGRMCGNMLMVIISWQREIQLENCREGRKAKENSKGFKGWGRKSSLSAARVARIVKAREEGKTLKQIAEDENLSVSYIHRLTSPEKAKRYNQDHLKRQREKTAAPNLS
jgi:DNA invertase Pin-like site-specific DNA recombinase